MAAAASAPAGLRYGEAGRFQGGAYCACAAPSQAAGREEGRGRRPRGIGTGVRDVGGRGWGWESRGKMEAGRSREVRRGRGRVGGGEV